MGAIRTAAVSFVRLMAIGGIFLLASGGWALLGTTAMFRAEQFSGDLEERVAALWGGPVVQDAPECRLLGPDGKEAERVWPASSRVEADIHLEPRAKGLVWYPTFACAFRGAYTLTNPGGAPQRVRLAFRLPSPRGTYDRLVFAVDDRPREASLDPARAIAETLEIPAGGSCRFALGYRTRGMRAWRYRPAGDSGRTRDLKVTVRTDFRDVDFPEGSISPTTKTPTEAFPAGTADAEAGGPGAARGAPGMALVWDAGDLYTTQDIAVLMPEKLNPGPLAARMTFFAPVCLLFFFVLVGTVNIVCRVSIHPMHYLFVAAGFFAFHLLFAYLVDQVNVHAAFALAAATAVTLVTLYLRAALGPAFPWKLAAAGQALYLVLFSYTFFLKGFTGLTVAVGSVLTLATLMAVTARTDWGGVFGGRRTEPAPEARPER